MLSCFPDVRWSDGSVFNYIKWNHNEPNNGYGNENCGLIIDFNGMVKCRIDIALDKRVTR